MRVRVVVAPERRVKVTVRLKFLGLGWKTHLPEEQVPKIWLRVERVVLFLVENPPSKPFWVLLES